jgi:hypothetical protein
MAILGKFKLDEEVTMDFGLEIYGSTEQPSKVKFNIEGIDYDISCKCEQTEDGVKVRIPKLKGIIPPGVYEANLSVELDGKIFFPLSESIEFEQLIEMDAKKKKSTSVKEGVKVTAKNIKVVSEDSREKLIGLEKNLQTAIKEGYEVSKVGEHYIMKKGELYAGLISERTILKSKKLHESLTDLVEALS